MRLIRNVEDLKAYEKEAHQRIRSADYQGDNIPDTYPYLLDIAHAGYTQNDRLILNYTVCTTDDAWALLWAAAEMKNMV